MTRSTSTPTPFDLYVDTTTKERNNPSVPCVSNPPHATVSADYFNIGFNEYASIMLPVNIVSVAATLAMLLWFFRKDLPRTYDLNQLDNPDEAIRASATFVAGWWVLSLLLIGFFVIDPLGVPISAIAALSAFIL